METVKGKTIQIYLPDGNPRGIKIADITSRTIQAISIPRSNIDSAGNRKELQNVGVYFLIGNTEEEARPLLYVGEAENCLSRIKQHNKSKDFWSTAIAIISKTQYFTKSHIKYLEWYCHELAIKVGRYQVKNSNVPSKPYLPEPVEVDLMDNFETISILVSTLGFPIFDRLKKPTVKDILYCKGKNALAKGEYTEDGLVVFSNSTSNLKETRTAGSWIVGLRKKLIEKDILIKEGEILKFKSDYVFSSPSAAAAVVLGRHANGWLEWKYKNGKTLDEVKRQ